MPARTRNKIAQAIRLGHNHTPSSLDPALIKRRPLQTLAAEMQTDVQHAKGLLRIAPPHTTECVRQRPTFMALKRYVSCHLYRVMESAAPMTT